MFGVDPDIGSSALRLWVAAGSAALLVFVCALAFDWTRTRTVARVSVVVVGAHPRRDVGLGVSRCRDCSRSGRRAPCARIARRGTERAGSCAGFAACLPRRLRRRECRSGVRESAVCLAGNRGGGDVLCRGTARAARRHRGLYQTRRRRHRRRLAAAAPRRSRPIGSVSSRMCSRCATAAPATIARRWRCLHDPSHVRANLSGQTLDRYLDHYRHGLGAGARACRSRTRRRPAAASAEPGSAGPRKVVVNIDFPDARLDPGGQHHESRAQRAGPRVAAAAAGRREPR